MTENDGKRIRKLIEDYYRADEKSDLDDTLLGWLASEDHEDEKDTALAELFFKEVKAAKAPDQNTVESFNEVRQLFGFPESKKQRITLGRRILRISAAAAAVVVMAGTGWLLYQRQGEEIVPPTTVALIDVPVVKDANQHLNLPDGSVIELRKGAEVKYSDDFAQNRTIFLDGEAYFKVENKDGQTFTVKTNTITVTVLGTEFHMKADSEAETSEITLTTGKVEVAAEGIENVTLTPGQHLAYHRQHKSVELNEIGEGKLARMRGLSISFSEESTLDEVFHTISAYYHKKLKVVDPGIGVEQTVIIPFSGTETIQEAMSIVKMVTNNSFDYRIEDDTIIITKPE